MSLQHRRAAPIILVFLGLVLMAGCSDKANSDSGATPEGGSAPPVLAPGSDVPGTTATANGRTVEMGIGTYCWTTMCVDKIGPVTKGTLQVSRGDKVAVALPRGTPPVREVSAGSFVAGTPAIVGSGEEIWSYPPAGQTPLTATRSATGVEVQVDLAPGKHVLTVFMGFERGDIAYGVVLEVR